MVINLIIFGLIFIILFIIINNINYNKPINKIYVNTPTNTWTPIVCDNYYQPCYPNWYYSEDYFYPI